LAVGFSSSDDEEEEKDEEPKSKPSSPPPRKNRQRPLESLGFSESEDDDEKPAATIPSAIKGNEVGEDSQSGGDVPKSPRRQQLQALGFDSDDEAAGEGEDTSATQVIGGSRAFSLCVSDLLAFYAILIVILVVLFPAITVAPSATCPHQEGL